MSGISTGVGLISGINSAQLIEQLIALERRPITALQTRVQRVDGQRTAFLDLSARLLSLQNSGVRFGRSSFFKSFSASSSNEQALAATAGETAVPGSYDIRVHSLVSSHALISRGFRDASSTPVGSGTITVELGKGRVNPDTRLDSLNGGRGVQRGEISIQDRRGGTATIDLSTAVTIRDVLDAINAAEGINVRASVTSVPAQPGGEAVDRVVVEDLNTFAAGETARNLTVSDRPGSTAAADLGIVASVAGARVEGTDLVFLSNDTPLSLLNDGNGVGRLNRFSQLPDFEIAAADGSHTFKVSLSDYLDPRMELRALNRGQGVRLGTIRITARSGESTEIDLSAARTAQDVLNTINANDLGVSATIVNDHFLLTDTSIPEVESPSTDGEEGAVPQGQTRQFIIEDVSGFAAVDLGFASTTDTTGINGRSVYGVDTIGDAIRAINYAPGNEGRNVEAVLSPDGDGITLQFSTQREYTVTGLNSSSAAYDLGIEGASFGIVSGTFASRRLVAGLNTVLLHSLNGGAGIQPGRVSLSDRSGASTGAEGIDLSAAETLQDVVDLINADGRTAIQAGINAAGNGIELRDTSTGANPIIVSDLQGTLAADLGIAGSHDRPGAGSGVVRGENAQVKYISRGTKLSELNGGRGVSLTRFTITDSTGFAARVDLPKNITTIGEVLDQINAAAITRDGVANIRAEINETGDGIVVHDQADGQLGLRIVDDAGGRAAADLRLAGTADGAAAKIDGSFEFRIEIGATDTLETIASKINNAGGDFRASVFNDRSSLNPFSLSISSEVAGRRGELIIDTGDIDLGLTTLSRARDAVVSLGGDGGATRLITSSSNTLRDVVTGVTVDLLAVSDEPVTITVAQDIDAIVEGIQAFVDAYNEVQSSISTATSFNPDTQARGPLLGDPTVNLVRNRLSRMISQSFGESGSSVTRLFNLGMRIGDGNRLQFDETRFRTAYENSPEEVEALFGREETGFGDKLDEVLDGLTRDFDGVLARKGDSLNDQKELLSDRIDGLNVLLERKRARLQAQFAALESALAGLQDQQSSLGSLQNLLG